MAIESTMRAKLLKGQFHSMKRALVWLKRGPHKAESALCGPWRLFIDLRGPLVGLRGPFVGLRWPFIGLRASFIGLKGTSFGLRKS